MLRHAKASLSSRFALIIRVFDGAARNPEQRRRLVRRQAVEHRGLHDRPQLRRQPAPARPPGRRAPPRSAPAPRPTAARSGRLAAQPVEQRTAWTSRCRRRRIAIPHSHAATSPVPSVLAGRTPHGHEHVLHAPPRRPGGRRNGAPGAPRSTPRAARTARAARRGRAPRRGDQLGVGGCRCDDHRRDCAADPRHRFTAPVVNRSPPGPAQRAANRQPIPRRSIL